MKTPIKLTPVPKTAIWGGTRLVREWGKETPFENLAESWELTVRADAVSRAADGACTGTPLSEILKNSGENPADFPLLVKFIDAAADLSVQVHPDDAYAAARENDRGKTEMWYVADATADAFLICGLNKGADRAAFAAAVAAGDPTSVMRRIPVKKGDCFFIPAGMPHAIGAGCLIAEIQQNCDLTYRVYDYDRVGADGKKRPLHVEKALDVVRPFTDAEIDSIRFARGTDDASLLVNCPFFSVRRVKDGDLLPAYDGAFSALLAVEGNGTFSSDGADFNIARGDCFYLPRGCGALAVKGKVTALYITP